MAFAIKKAKKRPPPTIQSPPKQIRDKADKIAPFRLASLRNFLEKRRPFLCRRSSPTKKAIAKVGTKKPSYGNIVNLPLQKKHGFNCGRFTINNSTCFLAHLKKSAPVFLALQPKAIKSIQQASGTKTPATPSPANSSQKFAIKSPWGAKSNPPTQNRSTHKPIAIRWRVGGSLHRPSPSPAASLTIKKKGGVCSRWSQTRP